jgi:hypothetical protein
MVMLKKKKRPWSEIYTGYMRAVWRARTTRSNASRMGVRRARTVRWLWTYGGGRRGWMASRWTCGFGGGKKEIIWGVGGRETVGRWVRDERAAEEEAVESVEKVRLRASRTERGGGCGVATVATERADEMEVRRVSAEGKVDVGDEEGDVESWPVTSVS